MNSSNVPQLVHMKVLCFTSVQIFSVHICSCSFIPQQKRERWLKKNVCYLTQSFSQRELWDIFLNQNALSTCLKTCQLIINMYVLFYFKYADEAV